MRDHIDGMPEDGGQGSVGLKDGPGGWMRDGASFDRIFDICMSCVHQDQSCVDFLNDLSEKLMTGGLRRVRCPKGVVEL